MSVVVVEGAGAVVLGLVEGVVLVLLSLVVGRVAVVVGIVVVVDRGRGRGRM